MVSKQHRKSADGRPMLFFVWNYKVLAIGLLLVIVGFSAMYAENEVHGFISLYLSPILIMCGYITVIFAIMKHDRDKTEPTEQTH